MRIRTALLVTVMVPCALGAQVPPTVDSTRGLPLATGTWSYRAGAGSSEASFGVAGRPPRLTLRCDPVRRQVRITRPDGPIGAIRIATSSATRLVLSPGDVAASDGLLDAIAFSRGRFALMAPVEVASVAGTSLDLLIVPAWPEPARIVEDCRK